MSHNTFLKSMKRRPLKAVILAVLLAAISFGFFLKATEYQVLTSNIDKISKYYRPIGEMSGVVEDMDTEIDEMGNWSGGAINYPISEEAVRQVLENSLVEDVDIQRSFAGVMSDIYTADYDGVGEAGNYNYFCGRLVDKTLAEDKTGNGFMNQEDISKPYKYWYAFDVEIEKVVAGHPENISEGDIVEISLYGYEEDKAAMDKAAEMLEVGQNYLFKGKYRYSNNSSDGRKGDPMVMTPLEKDVYALALEDIKSEADLSEAVKADIANCQQEWHRIAVNTVKDMTYLKAMEEQYYIAEGRGLTVDDYNAKNKVCVLRREQAERSGLKVGDTLTVTVYNLETPYQSFVSGVGRYSSGAGFYQENESITETYMIVGTYGTTEEEIFTSTQAMMLVPDSVIPEDWIQEKYGGDNYFMLKSPEALKEFQETYVPQLEAQQCFITFRDNGGDVFVENSTAMKSSARLGTVIFAALLAGVMGFALFFIIHNYKKDWLTVRLLGVSGGRSSLQLTLSALLIGTIGIAVGGIGAWFYASKTLPALVASLDTSAVAKIPEKVMSGTAFISLCGVVYILWLIISFIVITIRSRKSLMAWQETKKTKGKKG